jgi:hypothetical protein
VRGARCGDPAHSISPCVLLRAADQPIQRSTGGGLPGRGQVGAQPGVHEDPGQRAWADPKLLGLPLQGAVAITARTQGSSLDGTAAGLPLLACSAGASLARPAHPARRPEAADQVLTWTGTGTVAAPAA